MLGILAAIFGVGETIKENTEPTAKDFNMDKYRQDVLNGVPPKVRMKKIQSGAYGRYHDSK